MFWQSKTVKFLVGDNVKAIRGVYKGETGQVTHVTEKMVEINFDSGGNARVMQSSLRLLESRSSDNNDRLSCAIEALDKALSDLVLTGMDDKAIRHLADCRLERVHEDPKQTSQPLRSVSSSESFVSSSESMA